MSLIHSLSRRGVRVSVLAPPRQGWVARTHDADGYLLGRLPDDRKGWLATLEELADRHGEGVLISGSDRTTELLVAERERIPSVLRSFEGPGSGHLELMDKRSAYALAEEVGLRSPWTLSLGPDSPLSEVTSRASYPCVIKPVLSHVWRRLFGEHRVLLVNEPDQLAELAGPALEEGLELLVSEYVPGPESNLEGACTVRRADGTYTLTYGRRKLRQYPPGFGAGAMMESAPIPRTLSLATKLLDAASFVGVSVVEAKIHEETGEPVLIEANVRLPQGFGLGDACGVDASWRLYATLAGIPLDPQPTQRQGVRNVMITLEPRAAWSHLARGGSLRSLLASYRGVRDVSGMSLRDPLPLAMVLWGQALQALRYLRRRARRREGGPAAVPARIGEPGA
jgi:D-aspartate ligase